MRRRLLAAGGFALLAVPLLAPAQPPGVNKSPPGYVVIRVSLDSVGGGGAAAPAGGDGIPSGDGEGGPAPGGRGGPGGRPGAGGPGGNRPATEVSRSVVVLVPYTRLETKQRIYSKLPASQQNPPFFTKVTGPAGTAFLFTDNDKVTLSFTKAGYYLPALVEQRHVDWTREKQPDNGKSLVDEALSYGLASQAFQYATELADAVGKRKDSPKPAVAAFLTAFNAFKDTLPKPLPSNPDASQWQSRLGAQGLTESEHYAVIHFGEGSLLKEAITRRVKALENNFKAFYLWHALGGEAVPLPDKKLLVVVADKATDMPKLQAALDGNPITVSISDAFY